MGEVLVSFSAATRIYCKSSCRSFSKAVVLAANMLFCSLLFDTGAGWDFANHISLVLVCCLLPPPAFQSLS